MHDSPTTAHIHVDELVGAIARLVGGGTATLDRAAQVFADVAISAASQTSRLVASSLATELRKEAIRLSASAWRL
jgi:hypothetical protein